MLVLVSGLRTVTVVGSVTAGWVASRRLHHSDKVALTRENNRVHRDTVFGSSPTRPCRSRRSAARVRCSLATGSFCDPPPRIRSAETYCPAVHVEASNDGVNGRLLTFVN